MLTEKVQKIIEKYSLSSRDLFKSRHVLESKSIGAFEDETKNFSNEIQKIKTAGYSLYIVGNSKGVPVRAGLLEHTAAFWYTPISAMGSWYDTILYSVRIM